MRPRPVGRRSLLAAAAACAVPGVMAGPALAAQPVAQSAAPPAAASWPHTLTGKDGSVTVYQPQAIAWPDHARLDARMVVSIQPTGSSKPILGTIEVEGATTTDATAQMVSVTDLKLTSSRFPSLDTTQATELDGRIRAALAAMPAKSVPLDAVLLSLQQAPEAAKEVTVRNDPPAIYTSTGPASLVVFDGEPVMVPATGNTLTHAVNTNWDVFFSAADKRWFLLNNGTWFSAEGFKGPWAPNARLPSGFSALAADPQFPDLHGHVPGRQLAADQVPTIIVSTVPAEIIVTEGPPAWKPVPGISLQMASNTSSVLVRDAGGRIYYLVSGRWFSAPDLNGPWVFASANLPADFAMIPADGPAAPLLASVPGTPQAQDAVLRAQVPHQATLNRKTTTLKVSYAGPPRFEPIPGTQVAYAVNTSYPVFRVGNVYYACWQGAWFTAPSPTGPFVLAASVPQAIYAIPPSNPYYPVTYVRVYSATPTTVTYGFTAGYALGFITAGALVYGSGYYYPPVIVPGPVPAYFSYPYSYGSAAVYNPATGTWARGGTYYNSSTGGWARGGSVYGPYGGAGAFSAYNPETGRYSQGSASWNANGGTARASFYNPGTGVSGSTNQNANPYGRWGSSVVTGPNATVHTESGRNSQGAAGGFRSSTGAEAAGVHGVGGNNAAVGRSASGNIYAGADGNVYRKDSDGWSKWNDGGWTQTQRQPQASQAGQRPGTFRSNAGGTFGQLNTDAAARQQGWTRQSSFGQASSGQERGRFRR